MRQIRRFQDLTIGDSYIIMIIKRIFIMHFWLVFLLGPDIWWIPIKSMEKGGVM